MCKIRLMHFTRWLSLYFVLVCATGILVGVASGGNRTTDPGKSLIVYVNISDQGIKLSSFLRGSLAGNTNLFVANPARGQYALFEIHNLGKKPHGFQVLGKKIRDVPPGALKSFRVYLARRGKFPYGSSLDKNSPLFHGIFRIY